MKLELNEGRVFGARYYTVHPVPSWDLTYDWGGVDAWNDMMEWMVETFGPAPKEGVFEPGGRWYANNARFWFRNEQDRNWFLLKWQ